MPARPSRTALGSRPADRDPDRIARFGHVRPEPTVRGGLARRLNLARLRRPGGGGRSRSTGSGTVVFGARGRPQRVVVKVLSRRHWPGKGSGLRKHANYLARASASRDGKPGVFYSAEQDAMTVAEARAVTRQWEHDRHHFRVVISPEKADQIHDLSAYVRDVMQRIERDLQTRLQWIGINHHNTDNPHAHVLVRGVDERGQVLDIRWDYIAHGMRQRAVEAATELLGERTEQEVRAAKVAEVQAERFTSLDRIIERGAEADRFDAAPNQRVGFARGDRDLVVGRLQFLEALGLATKDRGTAWRLDPDFRSRLMELGARNDIIKQLYSTLGAEAGHVRPADQRALAAKPVAGMLLAKGPMDEISDLRFVAVRDPSGAVHYARVRDGRSYRAAQMGDRVELGRIAYEQRRTFVAVTAIAAAHQGVYRAAKHAAHLRAQRPRWSGEAVAASVQGRVRTLDQWAGRDASGVTRIADGTYRIDASKLDGYLTKNESRAVTDIRPNTTRGRGVSGARHARDQEAER
jgi:type IV secretory pathway VirD2 relaxase